MIATEEIKLELAKAREKHPGAFNSPHEAYGVLIEEVQEFFDEVRRQKWNREAMRKELLQIAAVSLRAIEDLDL